MFLQVSFCSAGSALTENTPAAISRIIINMANSVFLIICSLNLHPLSVGLSVGLSGDCPFMGLSPFPDCALSEPYIFNIENRRN